MRMIRVWRSSFLVGLLSLVPVACATAQPVAKDGSPTAASSPSGLPPIESFIQRPDYSQMSLSPDGKLLAAIVPLNNRQNLALIDLAKQTAIALTSFKDEDVSSYGWRGDRVIEFKTADLSDASGLLVVKRDVLLDVQAQSVLRDMRTSAQRAPSEIIAVLDRAGDDLVVQNYDRNANGLDAYRYNPRTSEKHLLTFYSPGDVGQFIADRSGQVRIAVSSPRGRQHTVLSYRRSNEDKWTVLRDEPEDERSIVPIAFDFDDKTLYVAVPNPARGGLSDVHTFDPETNQVGKLVFTSKGLDANRVVFDWVKRAPIGVPDGSADGVDWIDGDWRRLQQTIDAALPRTHNTLSWGRFDTSKIVVTTESETQPPIFYLLDRGTMKLEEVASAYPKLKVEDLSPRKRVSYKARDGLTIPAYLTLPVHTAGGKPPLIVDIHGGPFIGATAFGYDADAQFLASRGYAVLQPDFRGTKGYGDAFYKAGWKQWGLAMQDDVTDGVRWLIDSGQVDGDRVCLFGGSYGGYATLWGLEKDPQLYRCGVAFVAVSDLELLFDVTWSDTIRSSRSDDNEAFLTRTVGDPGKDRDAMRAVSPLYHADRVQAPLLLAYGGSDKRVPFIHGNRMRDALDKYHKPYEWVVYDNEGHGFNKPENRLDFYRRIEAFLAKNLQPPAANAAATGSNTGGLAKTP